MTEVLIVAIFFVVCGKWILIAVLFPFQVFRARCEENNSLFNYILSVPIRGLEHLLRGGWKRFAIYQMSTFPSCHIRKWYYIGLGAKIESKVLFHFRTEIRMPNNLKVGCGTIIGDNALLDASTGITLGRNVNLSSNVSIYSLQHNHRNPEFNCEFDRNLRVTVADRVWIGSNVIVLPGVTIGEGAVCCAGCVVTKDVEAFSVVAGIPAKKVGERPRNLTYEFDGKSCRIY